jgi:PAS domain S-box-containing protein
MDREKIKILLVEDDEDDYIVTRVLLSEIRGVDYELDWISTYEEAVGTICSSDYDVYLIDYRLGEHTGIELLRMGIEKGCRAPIILLTGQEDREVDMEAMKAGASDYLVKGSMDTQLLERSIRYSIERKRAEERLMKERNRAQNYLDVAGVMLVAIDAEEKVTMINKKGCEILGYKEDEIKGKNWFENFIPERKKREAREIFKQLMRGDVELVEYYEGPVVTSSGEERIIAWRNTILRDESGEITGTLSSGEDITRRKHNEEELKRSKEEAEKANLAKSQFLANMSHEIRTPMNAILGFAYLLKDTQLDETQRDYVETIEASGQILLALINDILDLSKIEAGEIELEAIEFNMEQLIESVLKIIRPKLRNQRVEMIFEAQESIPQKFIGDPTRIQQIILNLLSNAIKFTQQGEIRLTLSADIYENLDIYNVKISVKDTGIGIAEDKQKTIFDAFAQEDSSTTRQYGGTGLGLAIVKRLVESMKGNIRLISKKGKGSEFIVTLPLRKGEYSDSLDSLFEKIGIKHKKVMVIDDNESTRKVIANYCRRFGMEVMCTMETVEAALERLTDLEDIPDIIISEVIMSGIDGFEFARRLREDSRYKRVNLIALIPGASGETAKLSTETGYNAYLYKPVTTNELFKVLQNIFEDKQKRGEQIVQQMNESSLKKIKVLLAEDNTVNIKFVDSILQKFGCETDIAFNGQEAVGKVKKDKYDVVFMDIQMPVMDGFEAARIIRRDVSNEIPIIALTADSVSENKEKILASGMNDYLTKPVELEKLKEMLHKWTSKQLSH